MRWTKNWRQAAVKVETITGICIFQRTHAGGRITSHPRHALDIIRSHIPTDPSLFICSGVSMRASLFITIGVWGRDCISRARLEGSQKLVQLALERGKVCLKGGGCLLATALSVSVSLTVRVTDMERRTWEELGKFRHILPRDRTIGHPRHPALSRHGP